MTTPPSSSLPPPIMNANTPNTRAVTPLVATTTSESVSSSVNHHSSSSKTKQATNTASAVSIACKIMQQKGLSPRPAATAASYQQPNLIDKTTWLPPRETSDVVKSGILKRKSLFAAAKMKNSKGGGISIPRPSFVLKDDFPSVEEEEEGNAIKEDLLSQNEGEISPPSKPSSPKTTPTTRRSPKKIVYQNRNQTSSSSSSPAVDISSNEENVTSSSGDFAPPPSPSVARSPPPNFSSRRGSEETNINHQNDNQQYHQQHQHQYQQISSTSSLSSGSAVSASTTTATSSSSSTVHMIPKKAKTLAATPFSSNPHQQQQQNGCLFFSPSQHHNEELVELKASGLTPYRNVLFTETGESFILCVTQLGDRVSIYYDQHETFQRSRAFGKIPSDYLNGVYLSNEDDAREIGVEQIIASTGIAAGVANTGVNNPISGIISASTSQEGGGLPVYSIIIFKAPSSSSDPTSSGIGGVGKKASSGDRGVPSFIVLSDRKLFSSSSVFGNENVIRSFGVAPIVKFSQLLKLQQSSPDAITRVIRCTTASIERQHFNFSGKELAKSIKDKSKNIADLTNTFVSMIELVAEAREAETKTLAIEKVKTLSSSSEEHHQTISKRLSDLSCFASRAEEILGEVSTGVEKGLINAEREIKQALADLFVETKFYLPFAKGKINDSRSWGYSSHFNNIDFKILSKKVNSQFVNAATATSSSTFENLTNNPYTASALEEFPEIVLAVFKATQQKN